MPKFLPNLPKGHARLHIHLWLNRGADLRRGGGESEAFTAASESGRAPCCGARSATEQGARRSQHRDCARQGRAQ